MPFVGDVANAGNLNIGCHVSRSTDQTITNNVGAPISFDTVRWDSFSMTNLGVNPTRITIKQAGVYSIGGCVFWDTAASSTYRTLVMVVNGDPVNNEYGESLIASSAGNSAAQNVCMVWKFALNDFIELYVYQGSGGNLAVKGSLKTHEGSEFFCQYLATG